MIGVHEAMKESAELKVLIDVSIEGWRFVRVFNRLAERLELNEVARYTNQARYFLRKVDDGLKPFGLRIVSVEGQIYDPGMAISALNLADFGPEDTLVVEQMLEPIIMGPDGLVRGGTVMLMKAEQA